MTETEAVNIDCSALSSTPTVGVCRCQIDKLMVNRQRDELTHRQQQQQRSVCYRAGSRILNRNRSGTFPA